MLQHCKYVEQFGFGKILVMQVRQLPIRRRARIGRLVAMLGYILAIACVLLGLVSALVTPDAYKFLTVSSILEGLANLDSLISAICDYVVKWFFGIGFVWPTLVLTGVLCALGSLLQRTRAVMQESKKDAAIGKSHAFIERPINSNSEDLLGFSSTANYIASALLHGPSGESQVIAITGPWGSGKSSMISLIKNFLNESERQLRPHIIEFRPWLVRENSHMATALFNELISALGSLATHGKQQRVTATLARESLLRFVKLLELGGNPAKFSTLFGMPEPPDWMDPIIAWSNKIVGDKVMSLDDAKTAAINHLHDLKTPIICVVDDLDRLTPQELIEVLRLVRTVVDLPNVTYILSFDLSIVTKNVGIGLGADEQSGSKYIDKIIQFNIEVPKPDKHILEMEYVREIREHCKLLNIDDRGYLENLKLLRLSDIFETPRSLRKSVLYSKFAIQAIGNQVNILDLCWLSVLGALFPTLHRLISIYIDFCIRHDQSEGDFSTKIYNIAHCIQTEVSSVPARFQLIDHICMLLPGPLAAYLESSTMKSEVGKAFPNDVHFAHARSVKSIHYARIYFSLSNGPRVLDNSKAVGVVTALTHNRVLAKNMLLGAFHSFSEADGAAIIVQFVDLCMNEACKHGVFMANYFADLLIEVHSFCSASISEWNMRLRDKDVARVLLIFIDMLAPQDVDRLVSRMREIYDSQASLSIKKYFFMNAEFKLTDEKRFLQLEALRELAIEIRESSI